MKITSILSALLLLSIAISAQDIPVSKFGASITGNELKEHVKILSSDEFMGRETGREGEKMAAEYIINSFKKINLSVPKNTKNPFLQEFELHKNAWDKFLIIKDSDTLLIGQDFHISGMWPENDTVMNVVFVGYGTDTEHYSDYKNLDVNSKIVAFMNGEPLDKNGMFLTTKSFIPQYSILGYDKAKIAFEKGAVGAIMIDPDQSKIDNLIRIDKQFSSNQQFFLPGTGSVENNTSGLVSLSEKSASILFNIKPKLWAKYRKKLNKGKTVRLNTKIQMVSEKGSNKIISENVIGMIKGSEKPDEYIIITAHFDHLGQKDDKVFNGADDNASGTAAVIEIAEAFIEAANDGFYPKRSVIFMPVSGEEKGLLGSRYYTSNPLVPLEKTKAAINMDMIGRQDGFEESNEPYVYLYISDEPGSALDNTAHNSGRIVDGEILTVYKYPSNSGFSTRGSDHASFEDKGIPVMYFYCGTHEDYHRPTDTWEKLDYINMTRITKMVFASAWELANQD